MFGNSANDKIGYYIFGHMVNNKMTVIPVNSYPSLTNTPKRNLPSILTYVNKTEKNAGDAYECLANLPNLNKIQALRFKYLEGFAERAEELRTAISAAKASLKTIVVFAVSAFLLKLAAPKLKDYIDSKSMNDV